MMITQMAFLILAMLLAVVAHGSVGWSRANAKAIEETEVVEAADLWREAAAIRREMRELIDERMTAESRSEMKEQIGERFQEDNRHQRVHGHWLPPRGESKILPSPWDGPRGPGM